MNVNIFETTIDIDESLVAESSDEIRDQIREYESGDRLDFDLRVTLPDGMTGTVMSAMADIPYGETRTYGELATALDTTPIAVGQACGRNPVPLVVPCHRVVGSDGSLKGYSAADGTATKRRLLDLEAEVCERARQTRLPTR
ncbi:methylated-DNA/protein-cysteine methyltransferase [Haladaptatus paucihalophilus DX253]|uniref:Methylated-DNA-[protein]-cysteine S-methyltransferase n=1 Tax=Haladaptatus paucihalophilus DX253 TaxID=797209 RepID=E7QUK0_HALPU|nr:methylated-DNA--[protein]-cysteine S-methyltransferase [Haladaptatus paucihalophilus]EFW91657.1 methylated-DNA/protein-cysteine methyltransferase [Haladaptatus paucihalophilus DX253]SHJ97902.1 methylated-DNA-[protein]-cysteine S-methyltransferase [Haladaptatus paucihalophilus DX253]